VGGGVGWAGGLNVGLARLTKGQRTKLALVFSRWRGTDTVALYGLLGKTEYRDRIPRVETREADGVHLYAAGGTAQENRQEGIKGWTAQLGPGMAIVGGSDVHRHNRVVRLPLGWRAKPLRKVEKGIRLAEKAQRLAEAGKVEQAEDLFDVLGEIDEKTRSLGR
jgi:hypothetical protein